LLSTIHPVSCMACRKLGGDFDCSKPAKQMDRGLSNERQGKGN
jgi:hypothetical protein